MKHNSVVRAVLLTLLFAVPCMVTAQFKSRTDNYHFIYLSVSTGYSSISENLSDVATIGGVGAAAGVGYEFRHHGFWMNVGGQVQMHNSQARLEDYTEVHPGYDTQEPRKPVDHIYTFHQRDEYRLSFVDVPVMMGYYYQGFYLGVGGKASISLSANASTKGDFDLLSKYPQYIDMPAQPLENNTFSGSTKLNMDVGGALIGEVGYDVLASQRTRGNSCHILKVGFYFEYGINSVFRGSEGASRITFPNTNAYGEIIATEPQVKPLYATELAKGTRVVPYYLGVKLTYMFGGSRTGMTGTWHRGCQCYD